MSVNMRELVDRIPKDKLNEIVNSFTEGITAQQVLDSLGALGVEATEEEAQALVESLLLKGERHRLSIDELEGAAGGAENSDGGYWLNVDVPGGRKWIWVTCANCAM